MSSSNRALERSCSASKNMNKNMKYHILTPESCSRNKALYLSSMLVRTFPFPCIEAGECGQSVLILAVRLPDASKNFDSIWHCPVVKTNESGSCRRSCEKLLRARWPLHYHSARHSSTIHRSGKYIFPKCCCAVLFTGERAQWHPHSSTTIPLRFFMTSFPFS